MHPDSDTIEPPDVNAWPVRDRILMLGRRTAGKSVFLSRLYEQAWRGRDGLHMRATDGSMHEVCMDMVDQLKTGLWPAATAGSLSSGVDVSWQGQHATMVLLDYPGEVFRRAFVEGGGDEQSDMLIDHVDHAAAVILLIDPGNVHAGDVTEVVDDDYGMVQAVARIRNAPDGNHVPIAVALTKCDEHLGLVQEAGGARGFVEKYLPNLVRYGGRMRMFATASVRTRLDALGNPVPNTQYAPSGLIDSVKYCMKHVGLQLQQAEQRHGERLQDQRQQEAARLDRRHAVQSRRRWIGFWIGAAVVCLAVVGVSLLISFTGRGGNTALDERSSPTPMVEAAVSSDEPEAAEPTVPVQESNMEPDAPDGPSPEASP